MLKKLDLPPIWMGAAMALAWGIDQQLPNFNHNLALVKQLGWVLIALGLAITAFAAFWFYKRRTTIIPNSTPNALISSGPFRYSRNPIYLADVVILVGWLLSIDSLIGFIVVPLFVWVIQYRFILPEERVMRQHFGQEFDHYCGKTNRWV